jgi:hypothetical protein
MMTDSPNDSLILPGEILSTVLDHPMKLGPGLRLNGSNADEPTIQATQAGLVHKIKHSEFYVDYISHRVLPSVLLELHCQRFSTSPVKVNRLLARS